MKTFVDGQGREWAVEINVNVIKRVRDLLKIDLLEIVEGQLIERLIGDPILLCDVIYVVCKPQAEAKNITDEDFGQAMAGDAIEAATKALLEELADFSPSPRDRANIRSVIEKTWQALDKVRDVIETRLSQVNVEQIVETALGSAGNSSGVVPEPSASIPDN